MIPGITDFNRIQRAHADESMTNSVMQEMMEASHRVFSKYFQPIAGAIAFTAAVEGISFIFRGRFADGFGHILSSILLIPAIFNPTCSIVT